MQADESERLWRELCGVSRRIEAIERSAESIDMCRRRLDEIEKRLPDLLDKGDLLRLRDSIDALERSVLDVVTWERDSVVGPEPKASLSPARKLRLKVWEWVALAAAAALVGAAGTAVTVLAQSCGAQ